jgi:hypothetical protein
MKFRQSLLTLALSCTAALVTSTHVWANDVIYKDDFLILGSRSAGSPLAGGPETNASNNAVYAGHSLGQFIISTGKNNESPMGCLSYTSESDDEAAVLLPLPMGTKKFEVDLDVKPFQLPSSESKPFAGIVFANTPDSNYSGPNYNGQVRIGFNFDPATGAYRLLLQSNGIPDHTEIVPAGELSNFNPNGWNNLKVVVDYDAGIVSVFVNKVKVQDFAIHSSPPYVGIDAFVGEKNPRGKNTAYFKGFSVQASK